MAFLDESGLSYLWSKLKNMLSDKLSRTGANIATYIEVNPFPQFNNMPITIIGTEGVEVSYYDSNIKIVGSNIDFNVNNPYYGEGRIYFDTAEENTRFVLSDWGNSSLIKLRHADAIYDDESTTLGQVKSLIAESGGGGVSDELQEEIDGKVSKSGDTMTGSLELSKSSYITMRPTYGMSKTEYKINGIFFDESDTISASFVMRPSEDEGKRIAVVKGLNQNANVFEPICIGDAINDDNAVTRRQLNEAKPKTVTVTLTSSGWSNNTQTVNVTGVSSTETAQVIQPIPAISSQAAYIEAGIYASGQAANQVTFTCTTVPTSNLTVYVLIQTL